MDIANNVRPAQAEQFVAALFSPEIIHRRLAHLDIGAHGAVIDDHPLAHGLEKISHSQ